MKKLSIVAACLLGACTGIQTADNLEPMVIDEKFSTSEFGWQDGRTVPISIAILDKDGVYVVCAAAQNVRDGNDGRALGATNLTLNGRTMLNGLSWARTYPSGGSPIGKLANCRKTTSQLVANPKFDFALERTRFSTSGRDS